MKTPRQHILYAIVVRSLLSGAMCQHVVWEGGNITLPCEANGALGKVTSWCKVNENAVCETVLHSDPPNTFTVPPWTSADVRLVNGSSLLITFASCSRDNGTFRCVSGEVDASMDLVVFEKVEKVTLSGPEFPVPENTEVTFTCEAEGGNPAPIITWEIPETSPQPEPTVSNGSSKISLILTRNMHNKELVCRAKQGNRQLTNGTRLSINYKPTVEIQITPTEYYHGDHISLTCSTDGNPDPNITWILDDKEITDVPPPGNSLQIGELKQSHTGIYTCLAVNSEGNGTAELTLSTQKRKKIQYFWAVVVLPVVGLMMVGLIVSACYRQSETTNDQDVVPSNMSNEEESVTAVGTAWEADTESTNDMGAVGGMQRPQLQGHYASIWFDPEVAGTSGVRRSKEPTIYAQIDFKATTRLLKNKGKGKKSKV